MSDIVTFRLARQRYGLPVQQVIEVLHMVAITELPDLPTGMLGVINYRGAVIPLVDLRQVFEVPASKLKLNTPLIIAGADDQFIGLVVDSVDGVEDVSADTKIEKKTGNYLSAILKNGDSLLLMLDLAALHAQFQQIHFL